MPKPRLALWMLSLGMIVLHADFVSGQNFPNKPIRILTGGAGGGNDILARLIAQGLTASLGQQVVVDNRPSGIIPGDILSKSPPDGYTLAVSGSSFWIAPLFLEKSPYDAIKDFSAVTLPASNPNILAVTASLPVNSVRELIAYAKARPGELNYGTPGTGSSPHLAGELFKFMAGVKIVRINYKNAGTALSDLIAGQVQMTVGNGASVAPHAKAGRLKALAVTSAQPSRLFPDLPTVAASGLPGYEMISPFGVFAPANTPEAIVNHLNQEMVRVLNRPESAALLFKAGLEVVASSPEQLAATVKSEVAKWGKLLKDAGIHAN